MAQSTDGIVLLAKQSGITSFSSLWQIKNALGTKKIGHTGTLDTFAEGLLVALAGKYTRLVPFFSDSDKEYLAEIRFGVETDTLDPDGTPVSEAPLPQLQAIIQSLPSFQGRILQKPPAFSALHVNGQRASDLMRKGMAVDILPRTVTIHALTVLSAHNGAGKDAGGADEVATMVIQVVCSKGTYIRSLARDIANAAGSCAHLFALRRTRTGPFNLEKAAGNSLLAQFPSPTRGVYGIGEKPPQASRDEILASVIPLDPAVARLAGIGSVSLATARKADFTHGRTPDFSWFTPIEPTEPTDHDKAAVFFESEFMGVISRSGDSVRYEFVAEAVS